MIPGPLPISRHDYDPFQTKVRLKCILTSLKNVGPIRVSRLFSLFFPLLLSFYFPFLFFLSKKSLYSFPDSHEPFSRRVHCIFESRLG